jgi:hypothetical protein
MSCIYHVMHSKKIPSVFRGHLMSTNIPLKKRGDLHSFVPLKRKRKKKKGGILTCSSRMWRELCLLWGIRYLALPSFTSWYAYIVGHTLLWLKRWWVESKSKAQLGYGLFLGGDFIFIFQFSDITSSISIPRGM